MTFLEFTFHRLLGRPVRGSNWPCIFCGGKSSCSVRPPKGDYSIKFQCFRCGAWGDAFDLLREFYPAEDYTKRRARVEALRLQYERGGFEQEMPDGYPRRGLGTTPKDAQVQAVATALADLLDEWECCETSMDFSLQIAKQIQSHATRNGVSVGTILEAFLELEETVSDRIRFECEVNERPIDTGRVMARRDAWFDRFRQRHRTEVEC